MTTRLARRIQTLAAVEISLVLVAVLLGGALLGLWLLYTRALQRAQRYDGAAAGVARANVAAERSRRRQLRRFAAAGHRQRDRFSRRQHPRDRLSPASCRCSTGRDHTTTRRSFRRSARLWPTRARRPRARNGIRTSIALRARRKSLHHRQEQRRDARLDRARLLRPAARGTRDRDRLRHSHRSRTDAPSAASARRRNGGIAAIRFGRPHAATDRGRRTPRARNARGCVQRRDRADGASLCRARSRKRFDAAVHCRCRASTAHAADRRARIHRNSSSRRLRERRRSRAHPRHDERSEPHHGLVDRQAHLTRALGEPGSGRFGRADRRRNARRRSGRTDRRRASRPAIRPLDARRNTRGDRSDRAWATSSRISPTTR